jgi:hypothetical protein
MRSSDLNRYVLSISAAATLLTACGGSQPPIGAPGAIPQNRVAATHVDRGGSWMLPEAKSEDLFYISDGGVYVYTFPQARLVGILKTGLPGPAGMCPDRDGNVWITNFRSGGPVVEYAHGGTKPIATLYTPKALTPQDCSIDPTSGNLAVVGYGPDRPGTILVYTEARGTPKVYKVSFAETSFCGYDNKGNLFIDGFGYSEEPPFVLAELPKGVKRAKKIFGFGWKGAPAPSPIQWDGTYITIVTDYTVNRYAIHRGVAVIKDRIHFEDTNRLVDAWIQSGKVVVDSWSCSSCYSKTLHIYRYPAGGYPIRGRKGPPGSFGVTVSLAHR